MKRSYSRISILAIILALALGMLPGASSPVHAVSPDVVISQVYGGGGNTGAPYIHDFVELFNRGATSVSLSGWSIQYASATGTGNFGATSTQLTELPNVSLAPGQYFLIQQAGGTVGVVLPAPDLIDATAIAMSASAGKVALVNAAVSLGCNGGSTLCSPDQLARIIDLVGYGNANFFEGAAAPTLSNTTAALRAHGGCEDTDNNAADFTSGAPAPRNSSSPLNPCSGSPAEPNLTVNDVSANEGNSGTTSFDFTVSLSAPAGLGGVTFDIATADDTATADGDYVANSLTGQIIPAGSSTYTFNVLVNGDTTEEPDETFFVNVTNVTGASVSDGQGQGTIVNDDTNFCTQPFTPVYQIQGSGPNAAITGNVTTQGVVVGDYEGPSPALRGFFIQDPAGDGDPATSDGIFVFDGSNADTVSLGDVVRVTGTAGENQGQSQISVGTIVKCGTGTVTPIDVTFPVASPDFLEQYEGMLVRLPQTMYVTEHFQLGRFGQVVLSSGGRLQQPSNVTTPGDAANAMQAANNLNKIILDDASQTQNPDPIVFARGGQPLSASNTLRGGDTATGIVGVLNYTWAGNAASGNAYRIRPINALNGYVNFEPTNPRPDSAPNVGGTLRVSAMNTLNYFNTFDGLPDNVDNCTLGVGGAATDCRGADTQAEFDRQWPKTVAAILALDPDVLGLNEIENDGYGPESAIATLVAQLNASTAPGTYSFIDADAATGQINALGTDAIKVGMIYKPATVTPVGQTAVLNTVAFVNGGDGVPRSRPSLAQAFQQNSNGARFIVDVNHLKSKGSACDAPDAGDGQGNCNTVRVNAAAELVNWLATDPTGVGDPDVLIMGDLNSYAMEDPVTVIKNAGYTNLLSTYVGPDAYSYVFDGQWGYLDHSLGSATIMPQVTGVAEFHINADEPSVLDYNTDFKTPNLRSTLYEPDMYRVSDHDPVLVGLHPPAQSYESRVTGGGWIASDAGKGEFSFDVKYLKRSLVPTGTLRFIVEAAGFELVGSSYDWLVVNTRGTSAQFMGNGAVNGVSGYGFQVWTTDQTVDTFRIKIWNTENGHLVYDNGVEQMLGGGSVKVRK